VIKYILSMMVTMMCAALVLFPISSFAEIGPLWQTIGNWQVRVDRSVGDGCFMAAPYLDGSVLRVGFDRVHPRGYIMVINDKWQSLEVGKEYPISLQFDQDSPWGGTALATTLQGGNPVVLELSFQQPAFLLDLARKQALYVTYASKPVTSFRLTDSAAAVASITLHPD
jgi:hypothetical protein